MSWNPSDGLFRTRLHYLIGERGIDRVAGDYGVQRRTVRRWARGENSPSADTRRSVSNRGRRITGPIDRGRGEGGQFSTAQNITDPRVIRMREVLDERFRERRRVAIQEATTPSQIAQAESMPSYVDRAELISMDERRRRLIESEFYENYWDEFGYDEDSWDDWRSAYEAMSG